MDKNNKEEVPDFIKNYKPSKWAQPLADALNAAVIEEGKRKELEKKEQHKLLPPKP
jgi:hypothetical protein